MMPLSDFMTTALGLYDINQKATKGLKDYMKRNALFGAFDDTPKPELSQDQMQQEVAMRALDAVTPFPLMGGAGVVKVSKDINPKTAKHIYDRYSDIEKKMGVEELEHIVKPDKNVGNFEHDMFSGEIRINPFMAKFSPDDLDRVYSSKEWSTDLGTIPGFNATLDHEFGHRLDGIIKSRLNDEQKELYWNGIKELQKKLGKPSEYSNRGTNEWLAERFTLEQKSGETFLTDYIKNWLVK